MNFEIPSNCQIPNLEQIYRKVFFDSDESFKGTFVEIGAYDGYSHSNTYCLSKLGWKGVYIEPVPEFALRCKQNHKFNSDITVINAGISSDKEYLDFFVANTLTTSSEEQFKAYQEIDWAKMEINKQFKGKMRSPCYRLDNLLNEIKISHVDVLVIDTEGTELDVLNSFDLKVLSPKLLICEIEDEHRDFKNRTNISEKCKQVREKIISSGYEEIFRDEINTVFLRIEK
jgi:FkbM family methyltransferase